MSIAVSAVVRPSRMLRALLAGYGLVQVAAGIVVGFALPERFELAQLAAIFFFIAAAALLHGCRAAAKTRRIDISGPGQVRLTVQQDMRTGGAAGAPAGGPAAADGVPAELAEGCTVWPRLMLLHLRAAGASVLLPVLPDSVAPGVFRALAVAVGAIGGRNKPLQEQHKIL